MVKLGWMLMAVLAMGLGSCAPTLETFLGKTRSSKAVDQIMLVRREPPSFGYRRLVEQQKNYPDLDYFVSTTGEPDFLAETSNSERHYLILYYLEKRQAFACRSKSARGHDVEFAGPYPITDKEFRILETVRKQSRKLAQAS